MNDDMLSQDEIDALLNGSADDGGDKQDNDQGPIDLEDHISTLEQDALGEIGNISFGSSATALSSLLNQKVEITTPRISIIRRADLPNEFPKPHVAIQVTYTDGFAGENLLVIKTQDAAIIADLMLGGDGTSPEEELNEIHLSAVQEAMNQMMGSAATSMSTIFNKKIDISPPSIQVLHLEENEGTEKIPDDEILVNVSFQLKIGTLIDSNIMQLQPVRFAKELVDELMNPGETEEPPKPKEEPPPVQQPKDTVPQQHADPKPPPTASPQQERPAQQQREPQFVGGSNQQGASQTDIQSAQFQTFDSVQLNNVEQKNLDMLMDIPLKVTVELGRTKRTIREILEVSSGSVIELDKLAGEPVDIHVNEKLMAKGEVVVIDENFGVRVTDILSPQDRLSKLR